MLKQLIESLNVSDTTNFEEAYNLVKYLHSSIKKEQFKNEFKKPSLESFSLTSGTSKEKLNSLRDELRKNNIYGYILSTQDEYINEYTPIYAKRLMYISGFTGSYGFAIITQDTAALFVDGRYTAQANNEVNRALFKILPLNNNNIIKYILKNFQKNKKPLAINSKTCDYYFASFLQTKLQLYSVPLTFLNTDLIDNVWYNKPPKPISSVNIYKTKYAGENLNSKVAKVMNFLEQENLDALLITQLDNIAWLLNIRGKDIEFSPLNLATAILHKNGTIDLYIDEQKLLPDITNYFKENKVSYYNPNKILSNLRLLKDKTIGFNLESTYFYYKELQNTAKINVLKTNIITNLKAVKNKAEITNTKIAHYKDGAALTKLILFLNLNIKANTSLSELAVVDKINQFKSIIDTYRGNSFSSIVGANANSALPHYQAKNSSNCKIDKESTVLIDCGAQYLEGTTDVTRTLSFQEPTNNFKHYFTLVLKGLIRLSSIKFPKRTPCANLDALARQFLWQEGLDYNHGTGHGVGHYLSVHEGPIRFNQTCQAPLVEGMIISIEPGFYKEKYFGIRIENLVVTKECKNNTNFLEFYTLTNAPIDVKNIDFSMLTEKEITWLNNYHSSVVTNLTPYLSKEELEDLIRLTAIN